MSASPSYDVRSLRSWGCGAHSLRVLIFQLHMGALKLSEQRAVLQVTGRRLDKSAGVCSLLSKRLGLLFSVGLRVFCVAGFVHLGMRMGIEIMGGMAPVLLIKPVQRD